MGSALDLAYGLDASLLMRMAGMIPDEWQARALRSTSPRMLFCCCRQSGKSETAATLALHQAAFSPGSLVLLASPGQRQSAELLRKVTNLHAKLGMPRLAVDNTFSIELANASRVISLPGDETTVRGYSAPKLVVMDEASRIPDPLFAALMPMAAVSNARVLCLSTPWGRRGFFWQLWSEGLDWEKYEIPASHCPRISPAFLEEARRVMGSYFYLQEFECQFLDSEASCFSSEDIAALFGEGVQTWDL